MSSDIHFIFPRTRVAVLQGILRTTAHNAYPVVSIVNKDDIGDISVNNVSNQYAYVYKFIQTCIFLNGTVSYNRLRCSFFF